MSVLVEKLYHVVTPGPRVRALAAVIAITLAVSAGSSFIQNAEAQGLPSAEAAKEKLEKLGLSPAEMDAIIRDYLLQNPEIVMESLRAFEQKQRVAQEERRKQSLAALDAQIYANPMTPDNGVTDGDVTMVEFFDYQCGYCKRMFPTVVNIMDDDPRLRVIFKELPILGPASTFAARAALAARNQGKYMPFHTALMDSRGKLSEEKVLQTAAAVGLDVDQLRIDMGSDEISAYLASNQQLAQHLGITGTPALLVGRQFIPGAIDKDSLLKLIAETRASNG